MDIKAFIYHKKAEKYCDCQDYLGIVTSPNNRIAVSDGMSQSIFPQWWAKILVNAFLETGKFPDDNILPYQQIWQDMVRKEIAKQESEGNNPWLLRDMFAERSGAGATLCGFEWKRNDWICQCLGDTCLIKVKNDYSIEIITSQQGQFDNHPDYLDSFCEGRGIPIKTKGDFNLKAILLVTDPFSEFFQLHQTDSNFIRDRLNEIYNLSDHKSFAILVEYWRNKYDLHNDDSTLILLSNVHSKGVNIIWKDSLEELCDKEDKDIQKNESNSIKEVKISIEREAAEAQYKSSVENLLKYYPSDRSKSKNKVYGWFRDIIDSIVEAFSK